MTVRDVERAIRTALSRGGDWAELFWERSETLQLVLDDQRIEDAITGVDQGAGVRVVSGLHTVSAAPLADLDHALGEDVLVCGDRKADRQVLVDLVDRIDGLRGVHAGSLEMARIVEALTPLLISINVRHKTHAGIRITGL